MDKTIFALATGSQKSAISIIRISGPDCKNILKELTKKNIPKERVITLRELYYPNKTKIIDTCMLCWMPGPKSYTGEDTIEIYTHGGQAVFQSFFNVLSSFKNVNYAEQGEFSKRAIMNGKMNLIEAEAINDLINSQTEAQRELATKQYKDGLAEYIKDWRKKLIKCMSLVEATIDFSDEEDAPETLKIKKELLEILTGMKKAIKNKDYYELIKDGAKVVLKGKPNVGKSSIFNKIVKKEKSIVSNQPGTTRDIIESAVNLKGYAVIFYDTAGIENTKNKIEKEGIRRARLLQKESDIILHVIEREEDIPKQIKKNELIILNKIDKLGPMKKNYDKVIFISALKGQGFEGLLESIYKTILKKTKDLKKDDLLISNARQQKELCGALENIEAALQEKSEEIISEHLRQASRNLSRIMGTIDVEEILGNIFSSFCIGK